MRRLRFNGVDVDVDIDVDDGHAEWNGWDDAVVVMMKREEKLVKGASCSSGVVCQET
jgi:hypothetical protein